jgi:hypothetical protein
MSHHESLSPSSFPKLNLCIEYKSNPVAGPAAKRGTELHEAIEQHHTKGTPIQDAGAASAYARAKEFISDIRGVESRLTYIDGELNEITFGTADMWGYHGEGDEKTLVLVDYKSGRLEDPNSYFEQMGVYALMLMDREGATSAISVIVGIDTGEDHIHSWQYDATKSMVDGIISRVTAKSDPPRENKYCGWCAKRSACPVWLPDAQRALTVMPAMPTTLTREWILASPENAGRFLTAYKKLQALVEKDMDVAGFVKESIVSGTPVAGWKIQSRKGSERLDTKAVKARWKELTTEPIPATIGEDTISLVESK